MNEEHYTVTFNKNYKLFKKILNETSNKIIEIFKNTDLENKVNENYNQSIPQEKEKIISFLKRNDLNSYSSMSEHQKMKRDELWLLIKAVSIMPFGLNVMNISSELYLGQESQTKYIQKESKNKYVGKSLDRQLDLDIDVGINMGIHFYKINTYNQERELIAIKIFNIFKEYFDENKLKYESTKNEIKLI
ncbi:hypothetical protein K9L67_04740 [Candidatus Woesearchaeota archaeon]|nr:hypothetical protein [Candidatus Woesearchaeota archaeon]MCF7901507.1 hypothetical protein [Candidatus Woesearchaeota archaeon]MCF8013942.1 hypothetical protein [Candidatus Woesearchaeota archaeon]